MKKSLRLDKFLAMAGFGSRKEIKELVRGGTVVVNDKVVKDSSSHISPDSDRVVVGGSPIFVNEFVYLMLNKPAGYISATEDPRTSTVLDLVPAEYRHYDLFPVGRLDKDTEGLLLLTNDGKLAHDLLAPKKHVPKTYFVRTEGEILPDHVELFSHGVTLEDGYQTMPAEMEILHSGSTSEALLTIHEGKFHQVKRMFLAVQLTVIYLKRMAMSSLQLDETLPLGEVRELRPEELDLLVRRPK